MADFNIVTRDEIGDKDQLAHFFEGTLSSGDSIAATVNQIVSSTPAAGSEREKLKNILTRTVPSNKEIDISLIIGIAAIRTA